MSGSGLGFGLRIAVDLLAGLVIGVVLGLVLDHWLNTAPLMLVVFLFLGAAAGMLNVYRAATGRGLAVGYGKPAEGKASGKDDGDEGSAKPTETGTDAANGGERGSGGKS